MHITVSPALSQNPWTISNLQVIAHVSALDALGVDTGRVLQAIPLSRDAFADPKGRIRMSVDSALWEASIAISGDPAIGLWAGQHISYDALGGYGYLLQHSATGRQVFEQAGKYMRLVDDLARIETHEAGDRLIVRVHRNGYPTPGPGIDCLFAAVMTVTGELSPQLQLSDARVRIAHASEVTHATYEAVLGCPVELGAEHHELDFPLAWIDLPKRDADIKLAAVLQDHAAHLIATLPESDALLHEVRKELTAELAAGNASLGTLARALHLSERTLRRRLSERGTSYQSLLDELRSSLARKLVEDGSQSADAIAQGLGFADTSSFFHAFKRWTRKTPAQYRRARRGAR